MDYIIPITVQTIPLISRLNGGRLPELEIDSTFFVIDSNTNYSTVMNDVEMADRTNNNRTKSIDLRVM